jgi:hypothetical protein
VSGSWGPDGTLFLPQGYEVKKRQLSGAITRDAGTALPLAQATAGRRPWGNDLAPEPAVCPPDHAYFEAPLRLHHAASGRSSPPQRLLANTTAHDAAPHWALPAVVTPTDAQPNARNYCAVVECIWKFIDLAKVLIHTHTALHHADRADADWLRGVCLR